MDRTTIEAIIRDCECAPRFPSYTRHSYRAVPGAIRCYVHVVRDGSARSIGKLEDIEAMDEADLRSLIVSKCAQLAQGGQ